MTTRRTFIASGLALASSPLWAQEKPAARVFRIGLLVPVERAANEGNLADFRKALKDLGYTEGQNLHIEYRAGDAGAERYPALAADLAKTKADAIAPHGPPATPAAQNLAGATPVVTVGVVDPVETGLVGSLERPGGKVTGVAVLTK